MKFNSQQQEFFDNATNLEYKRIFLMGEAGTGKTFLICEIAKSLTDMGFKVVFASPTHQAKQIIEHNLGDYTQKIVTKTIASLLGRAMLRGATGEMFSLKPGIKRMSDYDIIICDEMSMAGEIEVNTFLSKELDNKMMIFTGDPKQLPPVLQKKGNIWDKIPVFNLTIQMRQEGEVYKLAKQNIKQVTIPTESSYNITVKYSEESLRDSFVNTIAKADNPLYYLYLAYTNEEVDYIAGRVHKALYGDKPYQVGQYIKLDANADKIAKGTEVKVKEIHELKENTFHGIKYYRITVSYMSPVGTYQTTINVIAPNDKKLLEHKIQYKLESLRKLVKNNPDDCNRELITITRHELEELEDFITPVISPYVMTIHKAQGITKPNVWVLATSLAKASNKRNLAYVAISRASNSLTINIIPNKIKCMTYNQMLRDLKKKVGQKVYYRLYRIMKKDPNFTLRGDEADFYRRRFIAAIIVDQG